MNLAAPFIAFATSLLGGCFADTAARGGLFAKLSLFDAAGALHCGDGRQRRLPCGACGSGRCSACVKAGCAAGKICGKKVNSRLL